MDNGVYILRTIKSTVNVDGWLEDCEPYFVWRVAHVRSIDDFYFYEQHEIYNLGAYMQAVWGRSPVFKTEDEATDFALRVNKKLKKTALGVIPIDTEYCFFLD